MTEQEWQDGLDPQKMLDFVQGRSSNRRLLLFRCARLRRHLAQGLPLPPADALDRETAEVLELVADGLVGREAIETMIAKRHRAKAAFVARQDFEAVAANRDWTDFLGWCRQPEAIRPRLYAGRDDLPLLFDLFGNPFHPSLPIPATVLQWSQGLVRRLAEAAYQHRLLPSGHLDLQRLAVLADALEEAGADGEMVEHLRGPGPHVCGCHVVDLLTGRE